MLVQFIQIFVQLNLGVCDSAVEFVESLPCCWSRKNVGFGCNDGYHLLIEAHLSPIFMTVCWKSEAKVIDVSTTLRCVEADDSSVSVHMSPQ